MALLFSVTAKSNFRAICGPDSNLLPSYAVFPPHVNTVAEACVVIQRLPVSKRTSIKCVIPQLL